MELDLLDWCVEAFLVRRNPGKNVSEAEYLTINKLNINEGLKNKFKDILKGYLCDDNSNLSLDLASFHEFLSDDSKEKRYKITKNELSEQNNYFENLLSKISEEDRENDIATGNFSEYNSIILKFSKQDQEILYFRRLKKVTAGKHKFAIHGSNIGELDHDLLFFDEFIDFIYFNRFLIDGHTDEERKIFNDHILIFVRKNFKTLFRLDEYCITKSKEFFNTFDFIDIDDIETDKKDSDGNPVKLKDSFVHDGSLNSQITRISALCQGDVTFDKIKTLKEQRGAKYSFTIDENKVKIKNKKQMKDLLDLIDEKIASPDWDKDKILRYTSKGAKL